MDKLFLIDGHALVFKMYYAFLRRPMINSKGADMSILYGFTKYLLEMVEREKPTHLAVAFDPPGGTFRNELYPEYKGTRPPTPQLIIDALEPLTELVQAMNIPVLMIKGFEADDVIGSMALRSAREGMDVYMVTPDKDYGQLIAEHVFQSRNGASWTRSRSSTCSPSAATRPTTCRASRASAKWAPGSWYPSTAASRTSMPTCLSSPRASRRSSRRHAPISACPRNL